jgi:hypothetical protein
VAELVRHDLYVPDVVRRRHVEGAVHLRHAVRPVRQAEDVDVGDAALDRLAGDHVGDVAGLARHVGVPVVQELAQGAAGARGRPGVGRVPEADVREGQPHGDVALVDGGRRREQGGEVVERRLVAGELGAELLVRLDGDVGDLERQLRDRRRQRGRPERRGDVHLLGVEVVAAEVARRREERRVDVPEPIAHVGAAGAAPEEEDVAARRDEAAYLVGAGQQEHARLGLALDGAAEVGDVGQRELADAVGLHDLDAGMRREGVEARHRERNRAIAAEGERVEPRVMDGAECAERAHVDLQRLCARDTGRLDPLEGGDAARP